MLTNHRPVLAHLLPLIISRHLYLTSQLTLVSVVLHPVLHSFTIESTECAARPVTMCPLYASVGSCGMSKPQVCVDCTFSPSDIVICRGLSDGCLFVVGDVDRRKRLVAPESNIVYTWTSCWLMLIVDIIVIVGMTFSKPGGAAIGRTFSNPGGCWIDI